MSLELAARALSRAERAGDAALATVIRERSLTHRFARSLPTQATAVRDLTIELAVLRDGHVGRASTNRTDDAALADCSRAAEAAAEAASRSAGPGDYPGFPPAAGRRSHAGHDPETALLHPGQAGRALADAFDAAERAGVEAHGIWTAAEVEISLVSSAGAAMSDRVTDAFMKVVCIAPSGRSGYSAQTETSSGRLRPRHLAERAAEKAARDGAPAALEPGDYPVVLEAHAVGALLESLAYTAFNGLDHAEGRGALSDRLGTRVATPGVNLSDSPTFARTLPRGFDAEGVAKAPLPLLQDGVAHAVAHDRRSAAIAGAESTGHALAAGGAPGGPAPTNLVLIGGGATGEAELCAPVERGVYVTRLWYLNVLRPKETLVTAVTRDGTFLIEGGRVTRPLEDMRLTDSVLGVLGRVEALSARTMLTSDGEFYGRRFATGVVCPAARIASVHFTGGAG